MLHIYFIKIAHIHFLKTAFFYNVLAITNKICTSPLPYSKVLCSVLAALLSLSSTKTSGDWVVARTTITDSFLPKLQTHSFNSFPNSSIFSSHFWLLGPYANINNQLSCYIFTLPWVAAQEVRWPGIPEGECSRLGCCSMSCDLSDAFTLYNTWSSGGTAHEGGGCDQSNGSTVSDAIVSSWLWSTATKSYPLGNRWFVNIGNFSIIYIKCIKQIQPQLAWHEYIYVFISVISVSHIVSKNT